MNNRPTERELYDRLKNLVQWEQFALFLPGIEQAHIDVISQEKTDFGLKKISLFKKWLDVCPDATWDNVVYALQSVEETTIASKIEAHFISQSNKALPPKQEVIAIPKHIISENVVEDLTSLHSSFVELIEMVKNEAYFAVKNDHIPLQRIVSRIREEKAYEIPELSSVQTLDCFFEVISPFHTFLNFHLMVCLAVFLSGPSAKIAKDYESRVDRFKATTEVDDLYNTLEVFIPQAIGDVHVHVTIIVKRAWCTIKLWLVEEFIKVLFGLHKSECKWFRVRSGSLVLDFLVPPSLIMTAIVCCAKKMEFMRFIGVVRLCIGRILVLKKQEEESFSFHNSLLMACKCANTKLVEFLLKFMQLDINKSSEIIFFKKETETSWSVNAAIAHLTRLQFEFSVIVNNFAIFTETHNEIDFKSCTSFIQEQRKSFIPLFNSVISKSQFFEIAQSYFFNFLNYSFLVDMEKSLNIRHCLETDMIMRYSKQMEAFKKLFSIAYLKTLQMQTYPPADTILIHLFLPNEWFNCSISMVEKLICNIFALKHLDELQWFKVLSGSVNVFSGSVIAVFYAPLFLQKQLIDNSKKKVEFMRLLGIASLKVADEYVFQKKHEDNYTFENGLSEAKKSNNADALQFLAEISYDLIVVKQAVNYDENSNLFFECDPDSTALMIACAIGKSKMVKLILDYGADPNIETKANSTALMYAVYSNNYKIVQMLIENEADINKINDSTKLSILHIVCQLGNAKILQLIVDKKPKLNVQDISGFTPLFVACSQLSLSMVRLLLKAQANPNIADINGTTPLIFAVECNCLPIVNYLLQAKADPNLQNKFGVTALYVSVRNKTFSIFQSLIQAGANPCIETSFQSSAFHLACKFGLVKMVEKILKNHKPDFRLSNGMTPIWIASMAGQMEVIDCLIKATANPNIPASCETDIIGPTLATPLFIASHFGHLVVVKGLLKANANPNYQDDNTNTICPALIGAIGCSNLEIIEALLEAYADPNLRLSPQLVTSFHYACFHGNLKIVSRLLKAKADPNVQDAKGETPLLYALTTSDIFPVMMFEPFLAQLSSNLVNISIVDVLLNAEADPNIANNSYYTPLHIASHIGRTDVVVRLLKANAKPNIQNIDGVTPLHYATHMKHLETIKVLLKGKADPDITDYVSKSTPLHMSCGTGNLTITKILIKSIANPNIQDAQGNTPLHHAVQRTHLQVVQYLVTSNATPNIQNNDGCTPLHLACYDYKFRNDIPTLLEMVKVLLKAKADPNIADHTSLGYVPLHWSCVTGSLELTKILLTKTDPDILDAKKNTPLHHAVSRIHLQILQYLILSNANPSIQNSEGYTPLHIACLHMNNLYFQSKISTLLKMAEILLDAQANPYIISAQGTVFDIATRGRNNQLMSVLQKYYHGNN